MRAITKLGTAVAAGAFTLALSAGTPATAAASATVSAAPVSAQTVTAAWTQAASPRPSIRWLCGKPVIKKLIPACTNGRWEPVTIKKMRCVQGHAPYVGWTGPSKLAYWAMKCFKTSEWEKW
ncbi:hypothetical protein ABZ297_00955 [Nonomuraea sp. NPDC005983]|uniref:hypothetical protein n=1 Tax=Nonomuraea sp. NPDC005983 TaxID=3155595 RepID=UPI0033A59A7E